MAIAERLALWRSAVASPIGPSAGEVLGAVRAALADDLQTPVALAAVDAWAERQQSGQGVDAGAADLIRDTVDALLGVAL